MSVSGKGHRRRGRLTRARLEHDFAKAGLFLRRACWDGVAVWLVGPGRLHDLAFQDCRIRGFATLHEVESWWRLQAGCHRRHETALSLCVAYLEGAATGDVEALANWIWGSIMSSPRPEPGSVPAPLREEVRALMTHPGNPMTPDPGYPGSLGAWGWRKRAIEHWTVRFDDTGRCRLPLTTRRMVSACVLELNRRLRSLPDAQACAPVRSRL